ncbi:MAG: hypothetical protein IPH63_15125 [Flavobacteriales bacterium]|nr:hypothetical protein [Flavobacteriales bacterium]
MRTKVNDYPFPRYAQGSSIRVGMLGMLLAFGGLSHAMVPVDDQWPVKFTAGNDQVQVFAPQPEEVHGDHFKARFAVSLQRQQDKSPVFGAVWGDGVLDLDRSTRLGKLTQFTVTDIRFPGIEEEGEKQRLSTMLSEGILAHTAPIPIDWLIAALENEEQGMATYANDPPEIIYMEEPAVLVFIDGEPRYQAVEQKDNVYSDPIYTAKGRSIDRVVNTPFLLVRPSGGDHYLYGSDRWFTSSTITGPWSRTYTVPQELRELANQVDTTASLSASKSDGSATVPKIVVRTTPAVLLDLDGPPQFQPLPGTALLYATAAPPGPGPGGAGGGRRGGPGPGPRPRAARPRPARPAPAAGAGRRAPGPAPPPARRRAAGRPPPGPPPGAPPRARRRRGGARGGRPRRGGRARRGGAGGPPGRAPGGAGRAAGPRRAGRAARPPRRPAPPRPPTRGGVGASGGAGGWRGLGRGVVGAGGGVLGNTEDDLFLDVASQDTYLLASGRWFATHDPKTGPWRYVPADRLPAEFSKIPEGSAKDGALAHIAGTPAAREAVRDASIPQTAQVDRTSASLSITYDGDPQFQRIAGTQVDYALNSSVTVLRIQGKYHALDQAVWFNGPTPNGPWTVSTEVPAEVNTIPPESPVYNTRYVEIYDYTPTTVYVGYTPGYLGSYVQNGVVIYGTGYYYRPWPGRWYPRPYTWGFGVHYNPWVGWGYGLGWGWNWYYPSWYGYGWGGYYRPYGYGCGMGWWGPYGYYPSAVDHNHYYYGHRTSLGSGSTTGSRPAGVVRHSATDLYAGRTAAGIRSASVSRSSGVMAEMPTSRSTASGSTGMDHFTDRSGNVYRRDGSSTERYENGRWQKLPEQSPVVQPNEKPNTSTRSTQPVKPAPVTKPQVDPRRIQEDRQRGEQRVIDHNRSQPTTAPTRTAPTTTPSPQRTAPSRSTPSPSTAPSRTPAAPRTPAPSRTPAPTPRKGR